MRKLVCLLLSLGLTLALCGCAAREVSLDPETLAAELAASGHFEETLYPLDAAVARALYGVGDDVSCSAWCGTGATAEEVAVFAAADSAAAKALLEALSLRNADRVESYRSYLPAEVVKLEHPVLRAEGKYVILCVCTDAAAVNKLVDAALR